MTPDKLIAVCHDFGFYVVEKHSLSGSGMHSYKLSSSDEEQVFVLQYKTVQKLTAKLLIEHYLDPEYDPENDPDG